MVVLSVEGLEKIYHSGTREVVALRGIDLDVESGEFVVVMGPSGCGKSTLLHLVGGMDRPSRGRVTLSGISLHSLGEDRLARIRRERIGFIFQFFNLLPTLTARENVELPLLLRGVSPREAADRAVELLESVGMAERAEHAPAALSGGEMQRVAAARALISGPDLVLADEPTGNLDSENGAQVMELLADINRRRGVTMIVATHSLDLAAYAGRIIHLKDGVIERVASGESVLRTLQ